MKKSKLTAIAAVFLAFCILIPAIMPHEAEEPEEQTILGAFPLVSIVASFIIGIVTGWHANDIYDKLTDSGDSDAYTRGTEAETVATSLLYGLTYYSNALSNYTEMWPLTNEHHTRQAEIAAAYEWGDEKSYSANTILESSGFYTNASYMLRNAAAQINEHYSNLNERVQLWNQTDTYKNAMTIELNYGFASILSKTSIDVDLGTSATATTTANRVYLTGGNLWVFGGSASITSADGKVISLAQGLNDLDKISSFESGVYTLQADRSYSGGILPVVDARAASIVTSMVLKAGNDSKLVTYTSTGMVVDNTSCTSVSVIIHPDGAESQTSDISSVLSAYDALLEAIKSSITTTTNAAASVWNIYNKAGEANMFLTTLMMPNEYENVNITQEQQEVMTILAMEQLADYYTTHSGAIKEGEYKFSKESLTLYVRGDIYSSTGEKLYENVTFTPFFYLYDVSLQVGKISLNQPGIMAIWDTSGEALSSWVPSADLSNASLLNLSQGCSIDIYEMYYNDLPTANVSLSVVNIDLIDPEEFPDPDPIDPPLGVSIEDWIKIMFIVAGIIFLLGGVITRHWTIAILGAILIAAGILLASSIAVFLRWL